MTMDDRTHDRVPQRDQGATTALLPEWLQNRWGYLALGLLAINLLFTFWVGFDWLPEFDRTGLSTAFYDLMGLLALVFGVLVARQPSQPIAIRRAWLWLALAYALNSTADLIYTYLSVQVYGPGNVPFPSQADFFYLGFYALAVVGIFLMPAEPASALKKTILLLDMGIVSLSAAVYLGTFLILPSLQTAEVGLYSQVLAVIYPLADLIFLIGILYLVRRQPRMVHPQSLILLLAGFVAFLAADVAYVFQALNEGFSYGGLVDAGYTWSFWLFMVASLRQYAVPKEAGELPPTPRGLRWISDNLPILAALAGFLLSAIGLIMPQLQMPPATLALPALLIAVLLVIQFVIRASENSRLTRDLQEALAELESSRQTVMHAFERNRRDLQLALQLRQILQRETELGKMVQRAVDLIRDTFGLYYVQVYLTEGGILRMKAGSGEVGRKLAFQGHALLIGPGSINGRAAAEKRGVVVEDTHDSPTFRANPLLPETRSELAVPILAGERLLGVLDLQSAAGRGEAGALSAEVLPVAEVLASELAAALEALQLRESFQRAQAASEERARRNVQQAWEEFLDAIEQGERIGWVVKPAAEGEALRVLPLDEEQTMAEVADQDPGRLQVPVEVAGERIGVIELQRTAAQQASGSGSPGRAWTAEEIELVQAVSARLARQVENLRLLAQAERFRRRVEEANRRQVQDAWIALLTGAARAEADVEQRGFIYDSVQVQPLTDGRTLVESAAYVEKLQVRGQTIGELVVAEGPALGPDQIALLQTVAERLGEHLEALRLAAQTEKALADTEALYAASEKVVRSQTMQDVVGSLVLSSALQRYQQVGVLLFDRPWISQPPDTGEWVGSWTRHDGQLPEFAFAQLGRKTEIQPLAYLSLLRRDRPVILENLDSDERLDAPSCYALQQIGRSVVIFPLVVADQWIGVLIAGSSNTVRLSESDQRQIQSLVGQAATVLQSLRLLQESQARAQREQLLRQVGERVRAAVEPELVLRAAVREVGQALGRNVLVRLTPPAPEGEEITQSLSPEGQA